MIKKKNTHQNNDIKYETYNSIHESLEQQNNQLMRQRQNNKKNYHFNIPLQDNIYLQNGIDHLISGLQFQNNSPIPTRQPQGKINDIYTRIQQVIELCMEGNKQQQNSTFKQVAQAEKQILGYLSNFNGSPYFNVPKSQIKNNNRQSINSMIKKSAIKHKMQSKGYNNDIGQQLMSIIEQIQRKALSQIDNLRLDKISLLKKLNQQIKLHNIERKKRQICEQKARNLTQELKKFGSNKNLLPEIYQEQQEELLSSPRNRNRQNNQQNYISNVTSNLNQKIFKQNIGNVPQSYQNIIQNQIPMILTVNSEFEIQNQINRLKEQNRQMKKTIQIQKNPQNIPTKQQLRNELKNLQAKSRYYQNFITNSNVGNVNNIGNNVNKVIDAQNLLIQGQNIVSEGQRLMRAKSIPQFRKNIFHFQSENQISGIAGRKNTITSLDEEGGVVAKKGKKQMSFGNQFAPEKYQKIIDQMNKVTGV